MTDIIISIGSSILVVGLLFFIAGNAFKTSNFKRKALIYFLIGLVLIIGCIGAFFYDKEVKEINKFSFRYFIFPSTILIYTIIMTTIYLVKAAKYNHHLRGYRHLQSNDTEQYVYIVFKHQDKYLLNLNKDKYSGEIVKFPRNIYFHDEAIKDYLAKFNIASNSIKFIGDATVSNKKKHIYFCYLVEVKEPQAKFTKVDQFKIGEINADEFDKQVILRIIIGEEFNIRM